jgi:hypothetical protein
LSLLMILHLSFATGQYQYREYVIPTVECKTTIQKIRRKVRAGRVWFLCEEVKK